MHSLLLSTAAVFPVAPATALPAHRLAGLIRGTVAAEKPLEQCLAEGTRSPYHDSVEQKDRKSLVSALCRPKPKYTLDW